MGWQLALQGTTVLAIGGLNKTIKDECESIADELTNLQDINVEGFANVEDAIRSLESSLINGIEELKWQLCSIDNKLGKLIGLVEFPNQTAAEEQFVIGSAMFRQEFYEDALKHFNKAIDLHPLILRAMVGKYLCEKKINGTSNIQLLKKIVALSDSDFKIQGEELKRSVVYYSNFCINEFSELEEHKLIVETYENELLNDAQENLNNRIKYVGAKISLGINVDNHIDEFLNNGELFFLLCFVRYPNENKKEYSKFADFILKCKEIIFSRFENIIAQTTADDQDLFISIKVKELIEHLKLPASLFNLGKSTRDLSFKVNCLNTFFNAAKNAPNNYDLETKKLATAENSLVKLTKIQNPEQTPPQNPFLVDAYVQIFTFAQNKIDAFKTADNKELNSKIANAKKTIELYKTFYPVDLNSEEDKVVEAFLNVTSFLTRFNSKDNIDQFFNSIQPGSDNASINTQETDTNRGKSGFDVVLTSVGYAKLSVVKAVKEITGLGLKESKELVDSAPSIVKENVGKDEAMEIKMELEEAGAKVELK